MPSELFCRLPTYRINNKNKLKLTKEFYIDSSNSTNNLRKYIAIAIVSLLIRRLVVVLVRLRLVKELVY